MWLKQIPRRRYFVQPISVHFWKLGKSLFNSEWTWQHFNNTFCRVDIWFNFRIPEKNAAAFTGIHKIIRDMQIFSKYSPKQMVTTIVSAIVFLKKNIKVRQAKSCDLFLQSQVTTHVQEWSSITKRLFMKVVSQEQLYLICGKTNTALGYNKGSECSQKVLLKIL